METITATNRTLNILKKASENGFELDGTMIIADALLEAESFLIENATDFREEECEVKTIGRHGQRVDWSDGKGYYFWSQGEIVDFRKHWFDAPDTKVFHTNVVDSDANVVKLYYIVGDTQHNLTSN